jgi:hypothetical protein
MPILGVIASSTRQGLVTDTGAMFPIASRIVTGTAVSSISFTSIPATYKHLQIRCLAQANTGGNSALFLNYNSDTTATNYYRHAVLGDGSTASTQQAQQFAVGSLTDNAWAPNIIDILDYANTNKYKTTRVLAGRENNSTGSVFFTSHLWMNTNAISTIVITAPSANFIQYSQFALYGIKGA